DGRPEAGFYAGHSHDLVPMEDCVLAFPEAADVIRAVKDWMEARRIPAYDETTGEGTVRHLLIRKGFRSGEILVCPVVKRLSGKGQRSFRAALPDLVSRLQAVPGFAVLSVNINPSPGNVILGPETVSVYGPGFITDTIGDAVFRISPESFYQVNPVQTEVLYGKALEFAGLTGSENVFDLYCGIGTISLFLARKARKVYGIEVVPRAIRDARENAALNGFTNVEFMEGKAEEVLPAWHAAHPEEKIDVIVVDPPRKGCDGACLETMIAMAPERIVYVSCEPSTLARDVKVLREGGYAVRAVQPVDMFPETVHIETVCLLSKLSEAKNHISVKVEMDEMDLTAAESKATYQEIQEWVQEKYGFHVSHLNIAKTKRKCGIIERQNYNLPKSEDSRSPETPKEKEDAIIEAFKAFKMI
ncbi:MAG: 23S rRNA (uracil(1939)-C(5))-methyltransferase RlmD, partial [Lachnospiraceae bacterium]|nr:23S rRNA (uracil(1939)-C(5))-methyltransferase RlmD [Lachnospiraceae bacterium]